ncbi:hypothetical protein MTQ10_15810 [Streptomyces sp. XM83C]|uniref:Integral membrane protein n=1 Tax=Streptomyces thermocoprophilus TaxID=78356 RepID=A0ABV5VHE6_9ACTN|nr:hypothetical protein [Streptomyces sp. XM83C]MCK1821037.1 hypothetical protein [Streptomyces sp. XM83C]
MSAALIAVVLSLFSAGAYASAAVAQERLAARSSGTGVLRLLGNGAWWWSVTLNAGAALLHVVALKYGPLTVVQPLGALTLVAAVPLGARLAGRRVSAREWRGTGFTLLGLGAILVTASGPAPDDVLSVPEALIVAGATAALIGTLSWGARPGLRHATASGIASGVASALTQTVTVAATDRSGPLLSMQVVGVALLVAAFATGGLMLSQTAYRDGLGAPLAMVTLANPVAAAVIGLALLGERLQGGALGALLALAGAGFAGWGVVLLTREGQSGAGETDGGRVAGAGGVAGAGRAGGVGGATGAAGASGAAGAGVAGGTAGAAGPVVAVPRARAGGEAHPVAVVLALETAGSQADGSSVPRPADPGHLTPL